MTSPLRLLAAALTAAVALAAAGLGWELIRFGATADAAAARLQQDVRRGIDRDAARLDAIASAVTAEGPLIADASASRDRLPVLFSRLAELAAPADDNTSVTVYLASSANAPRVLAWSDGPAEAVASARLSGPSALFVARGTAGLRLVHVSPVQVNGRRVATASAEMVLATLTSSGAFTMDTPFGPATIIPPYAGAGEGPTQSTNFVIPGPTGATLFEVRVTPSQLAAARAEFRMRVIAVAIVPIAAALLLLVGTALDARKADSTPRIWTAWSALGVVLLGTAAALLAVAAGWLGAPSSAGPCLAAAATLGAVVILAGGWWWRRHPRRRPDHQPTAFAVEQIGAGAALAATVAANVHLLAWRITPASLQTWQSALFPFDVAGVLDVVSVLLLQLALAWTGASLVAVAAARWRLPSSRGATVAAVVCWLAPTAAATLVPSAAWRLPAVESFAAVTAAASCGVAASRLRGGYRRRAHVARLLLVFAAILVPLVVLYPLAARAEDLTARSVIEQDYAPVTANFAASQRDQLAGVEQSIDAQTSSFLPRLAQLAAVPNLLDSHAAFEIWRQTSLSRTRAISDVELYGPNGGLVSRFALNLPPDTEPQAAPRAWTESRCTWESFGEPTRFGADDRVMLHAERALCGADGARLGAVAIHVAWNDYQALPFLTSANPYYQALGVGAAATDEARVADLQVVVYGWSFQPIFSSGGAAWTLDDPVFLRLYNPGQPFWTTLDAAGRTYHVHLSQNRSGIYALGYPTPTLVEHASRMAEIVALAAAVFVLVLVGTTVPAPLVRRRVASLRLLLHEIRTSFYRKLFLFFVLVAVVPVVLFAVAFSTYMTGKFRADVNGEAAAVATVAQRVFAELSAAGRLSDHTGVQASDDLMVWIREVIDEDVNLFQGADLVATSQRDLFDNGLLPTRTPAAVYRQIAFDRLPTCVVPDRLGDFQYLVAAAPIAGAGRDALISVPVALRQRDIERQIDELDRGVLAGAVLVVLFAAAFGASVAGRIADPVSRLTRATRQIAAGRLDVRITADSADELRTLVDDFNTMTGTLRVQRDELARTNQLKAWHEMARQVAHEIKNPLTPIQLVAEHLQRVHEDRGRPLGQVFDQCVQTILRQVRLLRQIASEFSTFASEPKPRIEPVALDALLASILEPYRLGQSARVAISLAVSSGLPPVAADRTLLARALTNLVENAIQAMPEGGTLSAAAVALDGHVRLRLSDTGVGMDADALARAFEPYFSTKTGGSGLGLANARRNIELIGGTIAIESVVSSGTTVTIDLKCAAPPGGSASGSTSSPRTPTGDSSTPESPA